MMETKKPYTSLVLDVKCYHCGDDCKETSIVQNEKFFCCEGCKAVYNILSENNLCTYYNINDNPGLTLKNQVAKDKYAFLENERFTNKLITFTDGKQTHITFYIPQMHCSSCIWLLENFQKINSGVLRSDVNFPKKEVTVVFDLSQTNIRAVVEGLAKIGYEPYISMKDLDQKKTKTSNRKQYFKIGIAGFCFGNIMMMSFPDYFAEGKVDVIGLQTTFNYINLFLSLPVLFFCASDFLVSAWKSIQQKLINIDAPIALAILVTFTRSVYEILSSTGTGYLDSMSGIVFFMLIGRAFQNKTYQTLSFERDYKSYFPVTVTLKNEEEKSIAVSDIKEGDRIVIRNNELIPADAILLKGNASIDYSFVTGETMPVNKVYGEIIYAGGKQIGSEIELEVIKEVSQSYLTELWNNDAFKKREIEKKSFVTNLSNYFSIVVFTIAVGAGIYWFNVDSGMALNAITSVLIVACPCALLLSATFTNGNILRVLGLNKFYLKNANVLEKLSKVDTIVFDKTGTITRNGDSLVQYEGRILSDTEKQMIYSLSSQSIHPLSRSIAHFLSDSTKLPVENFKEFQAKGIEGLVKGGVVRLGSPNFVLGQDAENKNGSIVYLSIDNSVIGHFSITALYREGFKALVNELKKDYKLVLLSGDNDTERKILEDKFETHNLLFNQSPQDKLNFIQSLQDKGKNVLMIGDGLNDSGALKQSNVGIAVSDNINNFSPACDAILDATNFKDLNRFIRFAKAGQKIIMGSFIISIIYNIVGIWFSVQGTLQPVIAAILMPASTISIVLFTTGVTILVGKKMKL